MKRLTLFSLFILIAFFSMTYAQKSSGQIVRKSKIEKKHSQDTQHISFMGIRLGQSQDRIDQLLRQKGFKYAGEAIEPAHMYEGAFWNYTKVSLLARTHGGKVTEILITPSKNLYNKMSDVNDLVASLNKKYGSYYSIDDEFNGSLVSYNWIVKGGCIHVTYSPIVSGEILITLRYIDYSSQLYVKPNASKKRNMGNDL